MWAISKETVNSLIGLSLNFFFILPLMNSGMCNAVVPVCQLYTISLVACRWYLYAVIPLFLGS